MMPRKRVASELARSSRRGLPRGLDGFDRDVPIGLEIGLELGLCQSRAMLIAARSSQNLVLEGLYQIRADQFSPLRPFDRP